MLDGQSIQSLEREEEDDEETHTVAMDEKRKIMEDETQQSNSDRWRRRW